MHAHAAWQGAAVRNLLRNDIPERVAMQMTRHKIEAKFRRSKGVVARVAGPCFARRRHDAAKTFRTAEPKDAHRWKNAASG
jgi:hypothetical protein